MVQGNRGLGNHWMFICQAWSSSVGTNIEYLKWKPAMKWTWSSTYQKIELDRSDVFFLLNILQKWNFRHWKAMLPRIKITWRCVHILLLSPGSILSWSAWMVASGRKPAVSPCPVQPYLMYSRACIPAPMACTMTLDAPCSAQIRMKMWDLNSWSHYFLPYDHMVHMA